MSKIFVVGLPIINQVLTLVRVKVNCLESKECTPIRYQTQTNRYKAAFASGISWTRVRRDQCLKIVNNLNKKLEFLYRKNRFLTKEP